MLLIPIIRIYNNDIHYEDVKKETTIIHFVGKKKTWENEYIHYDIEQLWWNHVRLTPFYTELIEEFLHNYINNPLIFNTLYSLSCDKKHLTAELNKNVALCQKLLQMLENTK